MTTGTIRKFVPSMIEGLADKRQVLVACSADGLDRQGDIVVQSGIKTASFVKCGGTVLWSHDPEQPIARALSIGIDGGQLRSLVQFPDSGISAKADEVYGLVKAQIINGVSIGFAPEKWTPLDPEEPWGGRKYEEVELMEFSFVSVPAQADATVIARAHGDHTIPKGGASLWKVGASRTLPIGNDDDAWDEVAAAGSIFEHAGMDGESIDTTFARKGFLAYDAANPTDKISYTFPFAKMVEGHLTAMPSGLRAAAAALAAADLPDDVRAKARAVLDLYEAKMPAGGGGDRAAQIEKLVALAEELKAGRALSDENAAHVKAVRKCTLAMSDLHTKALDSHGQTHSDLEDFRDHLDTVKACAKALAAGMKDAADGDPNVSAIRKACKAMDGLHTDALEANGETKGHLDGMRGQIDTAREHIKSLMKAARPKPKPEDDGDGEDPEDPSEDADVELAAAADRQRMIEIAERAA